MQTGVEFHHKTVKNGTSLQEYQERARDFFHGRDGSDQLQLATPVHLRAGLTGTAYEVVRKRARDRQTPLPAR